MFEKFVETGRYPSAVRRPTDQIRLLVQFEKDLTLFEMTDVYFIVIFCGRS